MERNDQDETVEHILKALFGIEPDQIHETHLITMPITKEYPTVVEAMAQLDIEIRNMEAAARRKGFELVVNKGKSNEYPPQKGNAPL